MVRSQTMLDILIEPPCAYCSEDHKEVVRPMGFQRWVAKVGLDTSNPWARHMWGKLPQWIHEKYDSAE